MYQVIDGKIRKRNLPRTGMLSDGRTVSGYDTLPKDILVKEGWKTVTEIKPDFDPETQKLVFDEDRIKDKTVQKVYKVVDLPLPPKPVEPVEEESSELDLLMERVAELEKKLAEEEKQTEEKIS